MVGHKDYPNFLKAAQLVLKQRENVTFCAVGDGKDRENILNSAEELGLNDRFYFPGFRKDIGQFLKSFDIFVMASKLEGLGTSILDAEAVGLPIVACNSGGIPETLSHNYNGLLVPSRNPEKLADAILQLCDDKKLRNEFGRNSLQNVKKFEIANTINKNIELYENLI